MSWAYSLIFLSLLCILSNGEDIKDTKDKDEVKWQPGVTFAYTSKQYSGHLRLSSKNNLHYWLLESQSAEPSKDPLFLWVPGGPGCSAISGLASIGPFLFNPDGRTVFENVYAWNKLGNILFLDTIVGPGYSYTDTQLEGYPILNDDKTVADLVEALKKFLDRFPEYVNRDFHILGESYAGVTIPLLTKKIIDMNSKEVKELKLNLKNIAIGNGYFSVSHNVNAHVNLAYFRGIIGTEDYTFFQSKCCGLDVLPNCNFSKYVKFDPTQDVYAPILNDNADNNICANKVADLSNTMSKPIPGYNNMDPLLDCYTDDFKTVGVTGDNAQTEFLKIVAYRQAQLNAKQTVPIIHDGLNRFVDQASLLNLQSTDQFGGYRCYRDKAVKAYFNRADLRRSLKIPSVFDKTSIDICPTGDQKWAYEMQYPETADLFKWIIDSKYPLGILIFNGDTDGDCSFLMASTFVRSLPLDQVMDGNRTFWQFQKGSYLPMTVGFYEKFQKNSVTLDLLTISGAPHRVETSHLGPALQMIANMLTPERNYSKPLSSNPTSSQKTLKSPLKAPPIVSRKQADLITDLPGLTFDAKFKQYSGYLAASSGNYLHYWLVESQGSPTKDPLILWLNGGPGCSSLIGLLAENGPVHINPDSKTLFENVYSWNRFSNILYLETPHGVGFSYHASTGTNPDPGYSDSKTLADTYLALVDFFSVYPEYQKRDFYIMGESYGGVYAPSLADNIIKKIQTGTIHAPMKDLNFVGLAIGNGLLSFTHQINSIIAMKYHRGFIAKEQWDYLKHDCFQEVTNYQDMVRANFSRYIKLEGSGYKNIIPIDDSPCAKKVAEIATPVTTNNNNDNIFQDCYEHEPQDPFATEAKPSNRNPTTATTNRSLKRAKRCSNTFSTDVQGGFPCYHIQAMKKYLNDSDVRKALHIPPYVQPFKTCQASISRSFEYNFKDTNQFFDSIVTSGYKLKILIYNGDLDFACNFIGAQWFVEEMAHRNDLQVNKPHDLWTYRGRVGGYAKSFGNGKVYVDLLTVKGGGHQVPMDRPGPAFQMIYNFVNLKFDEHGSLIDNGGYSAFSMPTKSSNLKEEYLVKEQMTSVTGAQSGIETEQTNVLPPSSSKYEMAEDSLTQYYRTRIAEREQGVQSRVKITLNERGAAEDSGDAGDNADAEHSDDAEDSAAHDSISETDSTSSNTLKAPTRVTKEDDKIERLPNITFEIDWMADQYSGYLNASKGVFLHYWLVTSQIDPDNDPLILWLNGGPGCSSLGGLFTTLGPYVMDKTGTRLIENVFGWTKVGHVLFLETPRGVGFSYSTAEADYTMGDRYDDTKTAENNVLALKSFFDKFPEYRYRPFYITGESYAGVYIPTLVDKLMKTITAENIDYINLVGIAIGNGLMSMSNQINSAVHLSYFRGFTDAPTYDSLSRCCKSQVGPCDFTQYINVDEAGLVTTAKDGVDQRCASLVVKLGFDYVWNITGITPYNTYLDCYNPEGAPDVGFHNRRHKRDVSARGSVDPVLINEYGFIDQAKLYSLDWTDPHGGQACFGGAMATQYLRHPDVIKAIHVDIDGLEPWSNCNDTMNDSYQMQYFDTTNVFDSILKQTSEARKLKFLIYNGDADMVCNFLGDQWFMENLIHRENMVPLDTRSAWNYTQPHDTKTFSPRLAGFAQKYQYGDGNATFNVITVKGAGHMVGRDRPGPMLQAFYNFVNDNELSTKLDSSIIAPGPGLAFANGLILPTKKEQDKIYDLPGLTFKPNFDQYSGYVKGKDDGNYLFYWMVGPQFEKDKAPVLLWMNGGPGCASLGGLLTEHGPFHINPDGKTLYENVYSWNKNAYVIYLESPRGVGFSYQDTSVNGDQLYSDNKTRDDVLAALSGIYKAYPELSNRDFYVTGESYAGVYVPIVTKGILDELSKDDQGLYSGLRLKLKGMAIGNGAFSHKFDGDTAVDSLYFLGLLGKRLYDDSRKCCKNRDSGTRCDVDFTVGGCSDTFDQIDETLYQMHIDIYNVYQQCYEMSDDYIFGMAQTSKKPFLRSLRRRLYTSRVLDQSERYPNMAVEERNVSAQVFAEKSNIPITGLGQKDLFNYGSNDAFSGFPCYNWAKTTEYLSQSYVREALHVPDYVQPWAFCNDDINMMYQMEYNPYYSDDDLDMVPTFRGILVSDYVDALKEPFRILIYNGDIDMACTFLQAQLFLDKLKDQEGENAKVTSSRQPWYHSRAESPDVRAAAGFRNAYEFGSSQRNNTIKLDFLTVKGSGHLVPTDRPGPALQMLLNYLGNVSDYSVPIKYDTKRSPLKDQYQVNLPEVTVVSEAEPDWSNPDDPPRNPDDPPKNPDDEPQATTPKHSGASGPVLCSQLFATLLLLFVSSLIRNLVW